MFSLIDRLLLGGFSADFGRDFGVLNLNFGAIDGSLRDFDNVRCGAAFTVRARVVGLGLSN